MPRHECELDRIVIAEQSRVNDSRRRVEQQRRGELARGEKARAQLREDVNAIERRRWQRPRRAP